MRTRAWLAAVTCLWACGGGARDTVSLRVTGCEEAEVRLLVFAGGDVCSAEDPRGSGGSHRDPETESGWLTRPRTVRLPVGSTGSISVVAQCRGADGIVRGWGCAEEQGNQVEVTVEPVCWPRCQDPGSCAAGAAPWIGSGGSICLAQCDDCRPGNVDGGLDGDGGPVEDAGPDAGCAPAGTVVQTLPEELADATAEGLVRNGAEVFVANGAGGVRAYTGTIDALVRGGDLDLVDAVGIAASGPSVFVASDDAVVYFVGADPNPTLDDQASVSGDAKDVAYARDHVFVASGNAGLRIVDVGTAQEVANQGVPGRSVAIALLDPWAILASDGAHLQVIDVGDPEHPRGVMNRDPHAVPVALAVDAAGNVAVAEGNAGVEMMALDTVTGQLTSFGVAPTSTNGSARGLGLAGQFLFVADGAGGLTVFDVADPTALVERLHVPLPAGSEDAVAVLVEGDWVLLAARGTGLHVIHLECLSP